jgi:2-polyprenyl-3-methyl-5-hydroxy-6-metoxy-1,4-benzoquinol methylase
VVAVRIDPEGNETQTLFALARFEDADVLEIGCGDGRLTWRYAERAGRVTAIDSFEDAIARAERRRSEMPGLPVEFRRVAFEEFAGGSAPDAFDVTLLSWSLC